MDILELVNYIDESGIALDDEGNEVRNEEGAVILVPEEYRKYYKVLEREERVWDWQFQFLICVDWLN